MSGVDDARTFAVSEIRGRTSELELGSGAIEDAIDGRGSSVMLEGEPGIGKSRLLAELVAQARHRGARVLYGAAQELERDRPFGALVDALADMTKDRPAFADLQEPRASPALDPYEPTLRYRVIEETVDLIEELSLAGTLIIALEDLHWTDTSTIIALNRLVGRVTALGVCLMVTARPTPRSDELAKLVESIEHTGHRIPIGPLPDDAVREILTEMLGAEPGPRLAHAAAGAGGNPLFVTELARAMVRDGALHNVDNRIEIAEPSTPPSLRLVIMRALSHLSEPTLDVLRVASILGTSFSVSDLARVLGRTVASIVPSLDEAAAAQVVHDAGDRLAFRHDLVRDAVYDDLPEAVRKALHAEAGQALAAEGRAAPLVATHFMIGAEHGDAEAVSWLRRAAEETRAADPALAVRFCRSALEFVAHTDPRRDEIATELVEGLLSAQGGAACEPMARDVLARHPTVDLEWRLHRALLRSLFEQGRHPDGLDHMDALLARPGLTEQQRAIVHTFRAATLALGLGDFDGGIREAEAAFELAQRSEDADTVLPLVLLCDIAYYRGELEESVDFGNRAVAELRQQGVVGDDASARVADMVLPLADSDRLQDAEAVARSLRSVSERIGLNLSPAHLYAGICGYVAGDWDFAVAELEAGLALAEEIGNPFRRPSMCVLLARIYGHREDAAGMHRVKQMLEEDTREGRLAGYEMYLSWWGQGFLASCQGDLARADELISPAWEIVTAVGAVAHYRLLGPDFIRIKLAIGGRGEASAAADLVAESARRAGDVATANGAALQCRGLVDGNADLLLRAVDHYRKGPRPVELAFACEDAGVVLQRVDRKAEALALLKEALGAFEAVGATRDARRVEEHLRALGVRRTGGGRRSRPVSGWEALTPAELTVVSLVCEGLTNRQIAERLFLSRRTIETHMGHIRGKLSVTTRTELVARFGDRIG